MAPEVERKLAAILSADVVGYSRLMAEDEGETLILNIEGCGGYGTTQSTGAGASFALKRPEPFRLSGVPNCLIVLPEPNPRQ